MPTLEAKAEAFSQLEFHGDTLVGIKVMPSQRRGEAVKSVVEIQLRHSSGNALRVIRFFGCANLRVALDFDVLAEYLPENTAGVDACTNLNPIRHLMHSQKFDWGVEYSDRAVFRFSEKTAAVGDLVFFLVQFCGGAVEVIAREYHVVAVKEALPAAVAPTRG